jgi:hypothetical protein
MTDPMGAQQSEAAAPLDELKSQIRRQAALRSGSFSLPADCVGAGTGRDGAAPIDWHTIFASLQQAEQYSDISRSAPAATRFSWPGRFVVKRIARAVMRLSRFVIADQSEFNNAVLVCLRTLRAGLYQMEQRFRQLERTGAAANTPAPGETNFAHSHRDAA